MCVCVCNVCIPFSIISKKKLDYNLMALVLLIHRTLVRNMLGFEPTVSDLVQALYSDTLEMKSRVSGETGLSCAI